MNAKVFLGILGIFIGMGVLLFAPARTFDFWQAWILLSIFGLSLLVIAIYLMRSDRALLKRRMKIFPTAEKEMRQKVIQFLMLTMYILILIIPAFAHRFNWSEMPTYLVIVGDILTVLGFFIIFLVFRENTFTAQTIEIAPDHRVISTGPYGVIRHPMYSGMVVLLIGMIFALGSWWGFLPMLLLPVFFWRIFSEEEFLLKNLQGYAEYKNRVRSRVIPLVW